MYSINTNRVSVRFFGIMMCMATFPMLSIHSQTTLYNYNGVWRIELPNKLELQKSELNIVRQINPQRKKPQKNINTQSGQIVFQQKGLNADSKSAYNKYCRVMINYYREDKNEPVKKQKIQIRRARSGADSRAARSARRGTG